MRYSSRFLITMLSGLAIAGCAEPATSPAPELPADLLLRGDPFVAVKRIPDPATASDRSDTLRDFNLPQVARAGADEEDYYLAIRKDALDDQWFLSAHMRQYWPGGVASGAALGVGTKVVSFRIQNDRLYVFDVDSRKASSDVFDPELLLEAYPIVQKLSYFDRLTGSREYILIDPAAGLNSFGVVGNAFGDGYLNSVYEPQRFELELAFVQRFRPSADGISYELVFTGYSDTPIPIGGDTIATNPFAASGTLDITLRRYREDPNFTPLEYPQEGYFYLFGEPRLITNTGAIGELAAHWPIYPGMEPIRWLISPQLAEMDATEAFAEYDLVETARRAIESWNDVFGFQVLEAVLASPADSFADDRNNYFIFDPDPSLGYAYATIRPNPNTGEILGATIYMDASWLDTFEFYAEPPSPDSDGDQEPEEPAASAERAPVPQLVWNAVNSRPSCVLHTHDLNKYASRALAIDATLTKKERFERYMMYIIAHEVGHTLSLAHNFKGSLEPPTSSIMDYMPPEYGIQHPMPGSYDRAAIHYLYGLSDQVPTQPFCDDFLVYEDPDCQQFDAEAQPIIEYHMPEYDGLLDLLLAGGADLPVQDPGYWLGFYAAPLLDYVRAGSPEQAQEAWGILSARVRISFLSWIDDVPDEHVAAADTIMAWILEGLYLSQPYERGTIPHAPVDLEVTAHILDEVYASLVDQHGFRSFETRRLMVDILESMQADYALAALTQARQVVQERLASGDLDARTRLLTSELLNRINSALTPYFE